MSIQAICQSPKVVNADNVTAQYCHVNTQNNSSAFRYFIEIGGGGGEVGAAHSLLSQVMKRIYLQLL